MTGLCINLCRLIASTPYAAFLITGGPIWQFGWKVSFGRSFYGKPAGAECLWL